MPYRDQETRKAADRRYYHECGGKEKAKTRRDAKIPEDKKRVRKAYYLANKEGEAIAHELWRKEHPSWCMLISARERAKKKGLEFSIDLEDILIPEVCPLLKIPIFHNKGNGGPSHNSPTIDRIDPTKGYVRGNVWVISFRANRIKNDSTLEELKFMVAGLEALPSNHATQTGD